MYLTGTEPSMRVGGNAVHMENIRLEINRMYNLAYQNISMSFNMLEKADFSDAAKIRQTEDLIDKLNEGITKEITESISHESNMGDSEKYSAYLNMSHDIERLSDHALNIVEYAEELKAKEIVLNPEVLSEIAQMKEVLTNMYEISLEKGTYERVSELEDVTDKLTVDFKANMVERLKSSTCKAEGSVIYSNLLINFERIGDHFLNVAQSARQTN
jgi:phosphate:Na+ symporter